MIQLQGDLADEKRLRKDEVKAWSERLGQITNERDEFKIKAGRDMGVFSAQVVALENTLKEEREMWARDRGHFENLIDESLKFKNEAEEIIQKAKYENESVMNGKQNAISESDHQKRQVETLKKRVKDQEESVYTTCVTNDLLRDQIHDQKKKFDEMHEYELGRQKRMYEDRVAQFATHSQAIGEDLARTCSLLRDENDRLIKENAGLKDAVAQFETQLKALYLEFPILQEQIAFAEKSKEEIRQEHAREKHEWLSIEMKYRQHLDQFKSKDKELSQLMNDRKEIELFSLKREQEYSDNVRGMQKQLDKGER